MAGRIISILTALLAAATADRMSLPLAWMLVPLVVSAAFSIGGLRIALPRTVVRVGQIGLGTSIGLNMSAAALSGILALMPIMLVTVALSILTAAIMSFFLSRLARIDLPTAFFASLPGGLVEMSEIGTQAGARPDVVALVQAIRVGFIVLTVPLVLIGFGIASSVPGTTMHELALPLLLPVVVATACGAFLAKLCRLNNPWILGPIMVATALTAASIVEGRMPAFIFAAAQFLMGYSLGTRFQRDILQKLPRVALSAIAAVATFSLLLGVYSALLSGITGRDTGVLVLATSIGGASEMAITAQLLHLDVALVVVFHLVRAFFVNGFATYYWSGLTRIGFFRFLERTFPQKHKDE